MNRRREIDRVETLSAQLTTLRKRHEPTKQLSAAELRHFQFIIESREHETWTAHDINIATQLAITMRRVDDLSQAVDEQGAIMMNARGTPVLNPTFNALVAMQNMVTRASSSLGLTSSNREISGENQERRNAAERETRAAINNASGISPEIASLIS